jgi:hypothetical protein
MIDLTTMPTLEAPGNGYREIKMRRTLPIRPGLVPAEIVLVYLPANKTTPFVTWQRNTDDGGTYWGHYFGPDEADEAVADFFKRGGH